MKHMVKKHSEYELWQKYGGKKRSATQILGPASSYQMKNTPRRILFSISRYKFAQKLLGEGKQILELGCSDGFGTYFLSEFANKVVGIDFDKVLIDYAQSNLSNDVIQFKFEDFMGKRFGQFDGVVTFDVIEHIFEENEDFFLKTIVNNLKERGIAIIGTPNITTRQYSSDSVNAAHVNMYTHTRFRELLEKFFHNAFIFSQNDEMIHTGFLPMAHYMIGVGVGKK